MILLMIDEYIYGKQQEAKMYKSHDKGNSKTFKKGGQVINV